MGTSEESQNPTHKVDRLLTGWMDDTRLIGNFVVLAIQAIFAIVAILLALLLICKKFKKPSYMEYILLILGCIFLLLSFGTQAWYSTCYDGDAANAAEAQGDICTVQGWVSASVCLCAGAILYGIDAFIWYFCRKRRVTWIGWYYDDYEWEIAPKGAIPPQDQEKDNLPENEEQPAEEPQDDYADEDGPSMNDDQSDPPPYDYDSMA